MGRALVIKGVNFSANKLTTVVLDSSIPCTGLSLSNNSVSFTTIGSTQTITATKTPSNTTDVVAWSTSNPAVATVSNGVITSVGEGSATITVTCGSQTTICSVSVTYVPEHVFVAGYNPDRRGSGNHAATIEKKTATSPYHVLAANNLNTAVLPIEDKDGQDTGEFRFVPIVWPSEATGFTITSEFGMKTRILWFDNTKVSDVNARGAWVVAGNVSSFDQTEWSTTITITKPSDSGINSFGGLVYTNGHYGDGYVDEADIITITYTYS